MFTRRIVKVSPRRRTGSPCGTNPASLHLSRSSLVDAQPDPYCVFETAPRSDLLMLHCSVLAYCRRAKVWPRSRLFVSRQGPSPKASPVQWHAPVLDVLPGPPSWPSMICAAEGAWQSDFLFFDVKLDESVMLGNSRSRWCEALGKKPHHGKIVLFLLRLPPLMLSAGCVAS